MCTKSDLTTKCFSCPLCTCTEDHSYIVLMWQQIQHQPHLSLVDREHVILYFSFQDRLWNKFSSNVTDVFCSKIIKVVRKVTLCHMYCISVFSIKASFSGDNRWGPIHTDIFKKNCVFISLKTEWKYYIHTKMIKATCTCRRQILYKFLSITFNWQFTVNLHWNKIHVTIKTNSLCRCPPWIIKLQVEWNWTHVHQ